MNLAVRWRRFKGRHSADSAPQHGFIERSNPFRSMPAAADSASSHTNRTRSSRLVAA
jgi:hypothetical protein